MNYQYIRQIGEGGYGVVTEASDETGQRFALKTFRPPPGVDADSFRKRFEKEVKYQSKIEHANVVRIIEANLEIDPPFFVMELASESLADELGRDHTLGGNPQKALFDILAGLEILHSLGITHRDLKPGNVLKFSPPGDEERYAISDFGFVTAAESDTTILTQTNMAGGTPYYSPPECATDFKRATPQSDIYSFGAILHDIFSRAKRVPHTELDADGPIGDIISKCTKKLPLRRYKTVGELRADLYGVINSANLTFESFEGKAISELLQENRKLNEDEWDRVFIFLEDNDDDNSVIANIFGLITLEHIRQLGHNSPDLLQSLGISFCEYVQNGTFNFNYCDVLGSKVDEFFIFGQVELKAFAVIALLCMGTSHNRWFVEQNFARLASAELGDNVASRVKIEVEMQVLDFEMLIAHVEESISYERKQLHPMLLEIL